MIKAYRNSSQAIRKTSSEVESRPGVEEVVTVALRTHVASSPDGEICEDVEGDVRGNTLERQHQQVDGGRDARDDQPGEGCEDDQQRHDHPRVEQDAHGEGRLVEPM